MSQFVNHRILRALLAPLVAAGSLLALPGAALAQGYPSKPITLILPRIGAAAAQVMHDPEVRQRLIAMGVQPVGSSPEQFARFLDAEMLRYAAAVKKAGVKLD